LVKVSVIIPVYNNEEYLSEALDSVISQTLTDIEIICINDGSTDSCPEILNDYSNKDSRFIVINQENQGSAISRNTALDIATGEYIAFLDADDRYIDKKSLELMYEAGIKNDASLVSANLKFLTQKRELIDNPHYGKGTFYYFQKDCEINPDDYGIPFYFYKNLFEFDLIRDIRFPNLLRGQDPVFLSEVLGKTDRIYGVNVDFYGYMFPTTFSKLDTYTKKYHYILQYKQCYTILNESRLKKTRDKYMHNLMMYLENNIDSEVYDIVGEVFEDDLSYFKNYEREYLTFKSSNILNKILEKNTNDYFLKAKNELNDYDLNLNELEMLNKSDNISDYKIKFFTSKNESAKRQYETLLKENNDLKDELKKQEKLNSEIVNSKSWKMMNKIRKLRG